MKAATLHEIRRELGETDEHRLREVILRLAKYKVENKELITYLLYEEHDESAYVKAILSDITRLFAEINHANLHIVKKSIRKILRTANKYSRYSGKPETTIEVLVHFLRSLKTSHIPVHRSPVLANLYEAQLKKIRNLIAGLHEDLQYDYEKMLEAL
jgi:hypothetical protein